MAGEYSEADSRENPPPEREHAGVRPPGGVETGNSRGAASRIALITGASAGIGAAFAERLAERGYDLLLVARRADRLAALGARLQRAHAVRVDSFPADLAAEAEVDRLVERIEADDRFEVLVNNAGFGVSGRFHEVPVEKNMAMLAVHVLATVRLTRAVLPQMVARNRGYVINVSSLAAFLTAPGAVTYCATKAYLNSFSRSIHHELDRTGVRVQALCPGFTYSEFHDLPDARMDRRKIPRWMWMSADRVVRISLGALEKRGVVCIPGFANRAIAWVARTGLLNPFLRYGYGRRLKEPGPSPTDDSP